MRLRAASLFLLAACGQTVASTANLRSTMAPPDAFDCVLKTFEAEGFKRSSYDKDELRATARRRNDKIQVSNTQFRRGWDVLEVDVSSGASGETQVNVKASTVGEYFSQQGPVFENRETSKEAQEGAKAVAERCGS
jgi:hypothetical protein